MGRTGREGGGGYGDGQSIADVAQMIFFELRNRRRRSGFIDTMGL